MPFCEQQPYDTLTQVVNAVNIHGLQSYFTSKYNTGRHKINVSYTVSSYYAKL